MKVHVDIGKVFATGDDNTARESKVPQCYPVSVTFLNFYLIFLITVNKSDLMDITDCALF